MFLVPLFVAVGTVGKLKVLKTVGKSTILNPSEVYSELKAPVLIRVMRSDLPRYGVNRDK
jgi:hypothetical protein